MLIRVPVRKMSEFDVKAGLKNVLGKIEEACKKRKPELQYTQPTLVAVSKTKPTNVIIEAYEGGQRHFGENYVQELVEKAHSQDILEKCTDIKWHFIGHLQTNKINKVLGVPNLYMIETVDSKKLATNLNKNWPKFGPPDSKLRVMIQVNTSAEEEKSGIEPEEVIDVTKYVLEECSNLELDGLMTIGAYGYNPEDGPNPDFVKLVKCREELCKKLNLDWKKINLSMGMSSDYEHAIELGSSCVRVGTSIFGYRPKKS